MYKYLTKIRFYYIIIKFDNIMTIHNIFVITNWCYKDKFVYLLNCTGIEKRSRLIII